MPLSEGLPQRKRHRKAFSKQRPAGIRNHLRRDFAAEAPNTKWVTDITCIRTAEDGRLYLCFVSTVGRDEAVIRDYIRHQEEDRRLDQMYLWR